jgi:hypothetical protein
LCDLPFFKKTVKPTVQCPERTLLKVKLVAIFYLAYPLKPVHSLKKWLVETFAKNIDIYVIVHILAL